MTRRQHLKQPSDLAGRQPFQAWERRRHSVKLILNPGPIIVRRSFFGKAIK